MAPRSTALSAFVLLASSGCVILPPAAAPHGKASGTHRELRAAHGEDHDAPEAIPDDPEIRARAARLHVLATGSLPCPNEVLGMVDVHEPVANEAAALELLKLRAAALGAEALVHVEFEHGEGGEPTHLSGTAVRCRDLLRGRSYDSLGMVEVIAAMGREDEAFRELQRLAALRGADVILRVRFEHGEAENETVRVSGLAVRTR